MEELKSAWRVGRLRGYPVTGNNDDYDVLADGAVVGRIFKANAAPVAPWIWTLAFSGIMRIANARLCATRKAARAGSPRAGGGNELKRLSACEAEADMPRLRPSYQPIAHDPNLSLSGRFCCDARP